MTPTGLEHTADSPKETHFDGVGGAKSGALGADLNAFDSSLRVVIEAWPTLPASIRAGILAMIDITKCDDAKR